MSSVVGATRQSRRDVIEVIVKPGAVCAMRSDWSLLLTAVLPSTSDAISNFFPPMGIIRWTPSSKSSMLARKAMSDPLAASNAAPCGH